MTRNPIRRAGLVLLPLLLPSTPLSAEESDLRERLRDALYTEEVTRSPEKAAEQYETLLAQYEAQRVFAASALFRLAEVRRKQDRKEEAIELYQRLIREFPAATAEIKLATENLAALGGEVPAAGDLPGDEEAKELLRLKTLAQTGPDLLKDPETLESAVKDGRLRVVEFLLEAGNRPYRSGALGIASSRGYLEICRMILKKAGQPPEPLAQEAIETALLDGRSEVVKFFLESGFDPDAAGLLAISVRKSPGEWDREVTAEILKAGADLNRMAKDAVEPFSRNESSLRCYGTPLHDALAMRHVEAANFLLDQGCQPDLPTAGRGITPLHIALYLEDEGAPELVKRLLKAGADPNRRTARNPEPQPGVPQTGGVGRDLTWDGVSPLEIAIRNSRAGNVPVLLEAGAKPEWPSTWRMALESEDDEVFGLLLDRASEKPPVQELLAMAVKAGKAGAVARLLDAGASPLDPALLDDAVRSGRLEMLQLLFDRGMVPSEEWMRRQLQGNREEIKPLLFQRFLVPRLLDKPAIHFFTPYSGWDSSKELVSRFGSVPPPSLAELLLSARDLNWPRYSSSSPDIKGGANLVKLWRKDEQGQVTVTRVRLDRADPLPELQWGDVIELDFDLGKNQGGIRSNPFMEIRNDPSPEIGWALQRRISIPVTLEIDGARQEITLRGDRLIHDPTSTEVPWCTAGTLARLRWQTGGNPGSGTDMFLTIARKEWPEIRLPFPSDEASRFFLRAGDQMKIETTEKAREEIVSMRKSRIEVRAAGLPYHWSLPCVSGNRIGENHRSVPPPMIPGMMPTLCQFLVQAQAAPIEWAKFSDLFADWIPANLRLSVWPVTVLPHPDWSRVRIHRLKEGGGEETLEVNLAEWIEELEDAAEIQKRDLQLKAGDIIELQVHQDRLGQPWKGLSAREEEFFAKALQGRVQIVGADSQVRLEEIRYKAPIFVETPAGWIPLPSKSGVQGALASLLLGSGIHRIEATRNGEAFSDVEPFLLFLKDGDQIKPMAQPIPQQPRQRSR